MIETGRELVIEFAPGFSIGYIDMAAEQELTGVFLHDGSHEGNWRRDDRGDMALDNLDLFTVSELLQDLTDLTGS